MVAHLAAHAEIEGVVLVGSGGRGALTPASDYDVLVLRSEASLPLDLILTTIGGRVADASSLSPMPRSPQSVRFETTIPPLPIRHRSQSRRLCMAPNAVKVVAIHECSGRGGSRTTSPVGAVPKGAHPGIASGWFANRPYTAITATFTHEWYYWQQLLTDEIAS